MVFIAGPDHEVSVLRAIFTSYVHDGVGDTVIAQRLNAASVPSESGRPWTAAIVAHILTSEKYIGNVVYNRKSYKLQSLVFENPRATWVRKIGAFPGVIDSQVFMRAQEIRLQRRQRYTKQELLEILRQIHRKHGEISTRRIEAHHSAPHLNVFLNRFETLSNAYKLAGVAPTQRATKYLDSLRKIETARNSAMAVITQQVQQVGGTVRAGAKKNTLILNGVFQVRVHVARAQRNHQGKPYRWVVPLREPFGTQFVIVVQLDPTHTLAVGYFLIPSASFPYPTVVLREEWPAEFDAFRFDSLNAMFG